MRSSLNWKYFFLKSWGICQLFSGRVLESKNEMNDWIPVSDNSEFWPLRFFSEALTFRRPTRQALSTRLTDHTLLDMQNDPLNSRVGLVGLLTTLIIPLVRITSLQPSHQVISICKISFSANSDAPAIQTIWNSKCRCVTNFHDRIFTILLCPLSHQPMINICECVLLPPPNTNSSQFTIDHRFD